MTYAVLVPVGSRAGMKGFGRKSRLQQGSLPAPEGAFTIGKSVPIPSEGSFGENVLVIFPPQI